MVPAPMRTRMPSQVQCKEERGRLYSVYMRPWTLITAFASRHVPHLRFLNVPVPVLRCFRLRHKTTPVGQPPRSFAAAWTFYIRGNVVSRHQRKIIVQFMSMNCSRSQTRDDDASADQENSRKDGDADVANSVGVQKIHEVLGKMVAREKTTNNTDNDATHGDARGNALQLGDDLWGPQSRPWPPGALTDCGLFREGEHPHTLGTLCY